MVLTDREIQAAIETKQILIDPSPGPTAYSSTSLDLALSKFLRVWKTPTVAGVDQIVCPATKGYKFSEFAQEYSELKEISSEGHVLEPGSFVLGWTEENIELPVHARLAARVEGKSSLARLGIGIHITAPNHPRWLQRTDTTRNLQSWTDSSEVDGPYAGLPTDL